MQQLVDTTKHAADRKLKEVLALLVVGILEKGLLEPLCEVASIHTHILQRHSSIERCMYALNYTINICNKLELGTKLACLVSIGM